MGSPGLSSYTGYTTGYTDVPPTASYPSADQPSEAAPYSEITGPQNFNVLPEIEQQPEQPPPPVPETKPITLLAFKDHTIVAVTDYWLEGDTVVYSTSFGGQTGIPIDRLDLILTEQLNRERNLRFVLESRP